MKTIQLILLGSLLSLSLWGQYYPPSGGGSANSCGSSGTPCAVAGALNVLGNVTIGNTVLAQTAAATILPDVGKAVNALSYTAGSSDDQNVQSAVAYAASSGIGAVLVPPKPSGTNQWSFNAAVTLPSNMTVYIENTTVIRSNTARDNLFRSANVGYGITSFTPETNVNIIGMGAAILAGALNPRSSGDSGETLSLTPSGGSQSYGTDAGVGGQTQTGDWRDYTVLFGYVNGFQISNLTLNNSQSWAISAERSTQGVFQNIVFNSVGIINGQQVLNQDGIDIRMGCSGITINGVFGNTGDDTVGIGVDGAGTESPGVYGTSQVTGNTPRSPASLDYTSAITGHDVVAYSKSRLIRLWAGSGGLNLSQVVLTGIVDNVGSNSATSTTIWLGAGAGGSAAQLHDITISNVISEATSEAIYNEDGVVNLIVSNIDVLTGAVIAAGPVSTSGLVISGAVSNGAVSGWAWNPITRTMQLGSQNSSTDHPIAYFPAYDTVGFPQLAFNAPGGSAFMAAGTNTAGDFEIGTTSYPLAGGYNSHWVSQLFAVQQSGGHAGFISGKGQHFITQAANSDMDGTVSVSSATSGSASFTTAFNTAPICTLTPQADPTTVGVYWVTTSTSAVTANIKVSGSLAFSYHCIGNPN